MNEALTSEAAVVLFLMFSLKPLRREQCGKCMWLTLMFIIRRAPCVTVVKTGSEQSALCAMPAGPLCGCRPVLRTGHGAAVVCTVCSSDVWVSLPCSCMFEPEGNACSLTDSTAEEHVLALVEHAADEARDRISRVLPGGKVVLSGGDVSPTGTTAQRKMKGSVSGPWACSAQTPLLSFVTLQSSSGVQAVVKISSSSTLAIVAC